MNERKQYLETLKANTEEHIRKAPQGSLRITRGRNGRAEYYHRKEPADRGGKYISHNERELIQMLAQKEYDKKVMKAAASEIRAIDRYLRDIPDSEAEEVYSVLSKERQELIQPVILPDEAFSAEWESVKYEGKRIEEDIPELFTDNGERVRSKSELLIANALARYGIPYRYEYPVRLNGFGMVHPDFMILNIRLRKEIFWEHLGRMDDEGYVNRNIRKIHAYIRNDIFPGENLILTAETSENPIDTRIINKFIDKYLV